MSWRAMPSPCLNGAAGSGLGGTDGGVDLCGQACGVVDREVEVREALPLQGDDQRVLVAGDVPELCRALGMEGPGELTAGLQPGSAPALGLVAQTGVVRGAAYVREWELQPGGVGLDCWVFFGQCLFSCFRLPSLSSGVRVRLRSGCDTLGLSEGGHDCISARSMRQYP